MQNKQTAVDQGEEVQGLYLKISKSNMFYVFMILCYVLIAHI